MAHRKEWLPPGRQNRLNMALTWMHVLPEQVKGETGEMVQKWKLWGISQEILTDFGDKVGAAQEALTEAIDKGTRTDVVNQRVKSTFTAMVKAMRKIKSRFFHIPPLIEEDFVSLGLKVPDSSYTVSGEPTAEVMIETFLVGRHQLGLRIVYVSGDPNDPANKDFRIYYKLAAPGEAPPTSPEELGPNYTERRKISTKNFDYGDSGKTVYFCVQIENGKKKGPWGPMTSALIP